MDDANTTDSTFFSLPDQDWADLDPKVRSRLSSLYLSIAAALAQSEPSSHGRPELSAASGTGSAFPGVAPSGLAEALTPGQLALRMYEVAGSILESSAGDEYDLRQVITTLRTALAVAWDFYGAQTAERVTVAEHMRSLKDHIVEFERELSLLRKHSQGPRSTN